LHAEDYEKAAYYRDQITNLNKMKDNPAPADGDPVDDGNRISKKSLRSRQISRSVSYLKKNNTIEES